MNRVLLTTVIILSLSLAGAIGYIVAYQQLPESNPVPSQQPESTLEPEPTPAPPQVFEKDVPWVYPYVSLFPSEVQEAMREQTSLRFEVEAGHRVEGIVTVWKLDDAKTPVQGGAFLFGFVVDPHGNIVSETAKKPLGKPGQLYPWTSQQAYPWKFSFIAATSGEYRLRVHTGQSDVIPGYGTHLKVTIYDR